MKRTLAWVMSMAVYGGASGSTWTVDDDAQWLTGQLVQASANHEIPAMGAAVFTKDHILEMVVTGVRASDRPEKVTTADIWHLGSCTKAMTATLAAMLVADGTITWETSLGDVFGDEIDQGWADVTLKQLVTQCSGFPKGSPSMTYWSDERPIQEQRTAHSIEVLSSPPTRGPGELYEYSNDNYIIAGAMLEHATGESWESLMRRRVFAPLGMKSAGFGPPPSDRQAPTQPLGHYETGEPAEPIKIADNPPVLGPAGTVYASIEDWIKFLQGHLAGGTGDASLIDAKAYGSLQTPAAGNPMPGMPGMDYASGWIALPTAFGRALLHDGSNTGWYCIVWLLPDVDLGFLIVCNGAVGRGQAACGEVSGQLLGSVNSRWLEAATLVRNQNQDK